MQKGKRRTTMNPRLEELRKRLMPSEATGGSDAIFTRNSQSAPADRSKQPPVGAAEAAEWKSDAQVPPPGEAVAHQKLDNEDGQASPDKAKSMDQRAQIVATPFEPARRYRERLSTTCKSIRTGSCSSLSCASKPLRPAGGRRCCRHAGRCPHVR